MANEEGKADTMQMAEQTLKAGKEFEPRFRPKAEGEWCYDNDESVTQQAMAWHFFLALQLLEALFNLRGSNWPSPAGVLFRTFSEIVSRGIWMMHPENPADRAGRARSYVDYAQMKQDEMDKRMKFVRDFVGDKGTTEETLRAALQEYQKKEDAKSESKIRNAIKCKYGDNACTIPYREMLEEIDLAGEHITVYPMASAATHGVLTKFDKESPHEVVMDYIVTAADRFYVLAHRTAMALGIPEEELNSAFRAAIQAREKKAEQDKQRMRS